MPKFKYKAKESLHKVIEGIVEADHMNTAVNKIIQRGLTPIDVVPAGPDAGRIPRQDILSRRRVFRGVGRADLVLFTRQLSDLVEASVPILRSLRIISNQTPNRRFKDIVGQLRHFVQDGGSLSSALARYPELFSSFYVNMVRSGEMSGQLDKILGRLADFTEKEQETRGKIQSSLAYPLLILAAGIGTIFVLLTFVIPRISVMFDDLDQALPLPTTVLMGVSGFFARYWWLMLGALVGGGVYFKKWLNLPRGRRQCDALKLRVPLWGRFIKIVEAGRFARTLGTLVGSGVAVTATLDSVWAVMDNTVLREEIKKMSQRVADGSSLTEAVRQCPFFPAMVTDMISVGEETGRLDRGLYKIADTFEREADRTTGTMISLLGPAVLAAVVSLVGFVVIALLLPIFRMNLLIQ